MNNEIEIDLLQTMKALLKKLWLILLAALICGGAMFGYNKAGYTPSYNAQAYLYIGYTHNRDIALGENTGSLSYSSIDEARKLVGTGTAMLKTPSVRKKIIAKSGLELTEKELASKISAWSIDGSELFTVWSGDADADNAILLANTVAEVLSERMMQVNENCTVTLVDSAKQATLATTEPGLKDAATGAIAGAFLVCAAVAVVDIIRQIKEAKKKEQL